jgi:hypothetical protein
MRRPALPTTPSVLVFFDFNRLFANVKPIWRKRPHRRLEPNRSRFEGNASIGSLSIGGGASAPRQLLLRRKWEAVQAPVQGRRRRLTTARW